jgi:hypothetical protein
VWKVGVPQLKVYQLRTGRAHQQEGFRWSLRASERYPGVFIGINEALR